jgi:hypothetical protein
MSEETNKERKQRHPPFKDDIERGKYYAEYKRNYYYKNRDRIIAKINEHYEKRMQERIAKAIAEGREPPKRRKKRTAPAPAPAPAPANN